MGFKHRTKLIARRRTLNAKLKSLQDELREINGELSSRSEVELQGRLKQVLAANHGNVSATARDFGVFPVQVRRWCQRLEIGIDDFRPDDDDEG